MYTIFTGPRLYKSYDSGEQVTRKAVVLGDSFVLLGVDAAPLVAVAEVVGRLQIAVGPQTLVVGVWRVLDNPPWPGQSPTHAV